MNRTEAREYAAELMEEVNENGWGQILSLGLPPEVEEMLRVLRQLNGDITKLEAREKELSDALVTRLMPLEFDDGSEPVPATPDPSQARGSQPTTEPEPATPANPMADLFIQRRTAS